MRKKTRPSWTRICTLLSPAKKSGVHPRKLISFKTLMAISAFALLMLISDHTMAQQWQILANEQSITSVVANYTNIALVNDGPNSVPYVIYTEAGIAKVKSQKNGTWSQVGGNVAAASASYTRIYADKTGNLYVTYMDGANGNKLAVKKWNSASGAWEPLNNNSANLYVSSGSVNNNVSQYSSTPRSSLAFDANNTPYIAFGDAGNLVPYVKKFDGISWVTVGTGAVNAAAKAVGISLVIDENNTPWLTFCSLSATNSTSGSLALYSYNAGTWTPATVNIGSIRHTSMALDAAGNLAIAYFNTANSNRATVIVYNKTTGTWSAATALSGRDATYINLVRDVSGNLYASFVDAMSSSYLSAARVRKLAVGTTSWSELKAPEVPNGVDQPVSNLSIAVGNDTAKPVIVYTKTNSTGISTPVVRMFIPPAAPSVLSTSTVTTINTTSVVIGGDITSDGGSSITERGIVYSMSVKNPTTADIRVSDASTGSGPFTVTLSNLTPATFYYVRAYAINSGGTSYGNTVRVNSLSTPDAVVTTPKQMEYLDRGLVAVRRNTSSVYVGWRLLGNDPSGIAFNVYRDGVKLNEAPITTSTNFVDNTATNGTYSVKPVINGAEGVASAPVTVWGNNQLHIPLQIPAGGITPDGAAYTYSANDCSVGDVDGDGQYEIFVKWDPSELNHNSGGYSGDQIIDCYKLNGTRLWRINLGKNINAGPHFTQFMVYDLDGDGKAEMACKTADGTIDGLGVVIGDPMVDYRNSNGWVDKGPEYLTVFNGLTGAAMATVNYALTRGSYGDWGDTYGNRAERYVSAIAYLDGARPSLVIGRGYYEKLTRAAYDWRDGKLTLRWKFDSEDTNYPANGAYTGQGNHQMTIGDVDGDGKDEVINGSSAIDDDGTRLWTYRYGHGDALHMTDMDPDRPGQEIWQCLESPGDYSPYGLRLNDAKTGETIFGVTTTGDVGRALAGDIDPAHKGYEMWGSSGNLYNVKGEQIGTSRPTGGSQAVNFGIWWDGDLGRELLDGTILDKWNPTTKSLNRVFTIYQAAPVSSNNDSKKNPGLTADLLGDWREEIILRRSDNTALILFTTTTPTEHRIHTLMHDPQYRTAVAWQNSGYNQPPYPSFYLGYDMAAPPTPNIKVTDIIPPTVTSITKQDVLPEVTNATSVTYRVHFSEDVQGAKTSEFALTTTGNVAGNITSVTPVSGASIDVTVSEISGDGTLRLDVKGSNTGITDEAGNPLSDSFTEGPSYNFDHTSPLITNVAVDKPLLVVPNHKMEDIKVNYEIIDANSFNTVLSISSNEAVNGLGDGDTAPDWKIVDEHNVQLRAERSGTGNGRIYTITITATDIVGNTSTQVVTVTVPANQKGQNQRTSITASENVSMQQKLNVVVYPNPAPQYFTLNIQSSNYAPVDVVLTDLTGKVIETKSGVAANSNITFGHSCQPGIYLVQVIQGTEKLTLKLIKKGD